MKSQFEKAYHRRASQNLLKEPLNTRALRLWYGPGEAQEGALENWAIDGYGPFLWITEWEAARSNTADLAWIQKLAQETQGFYEPLGYRGAVILSRPRQGVPELPKLLWGAVPDDKFEVREGDLRFWIRLLERGTQASSWTIGPFGIGSPSVELAAEKKYSTLFLTPGASVSPPVWVGP